MSYEELCASTDGIATRMPPTERLLLWAVRAWSAYHHDLSGVWWSLDRAFTAARIRPALDPFDAMMSMLFAGLRYWPDIRCVRCPHLGSDEALLLAAMSHLQRGDRSAALAALGTLATPAAARKCCDAAVEVVRAMNESQLSFSIESDWMAVTAVDPLAQPQSTPGEWSTRH